MKAWFLAWIAVVVGVACGGNVVVDSANGAGAGSIGTGVGSGAGAGNGGGPCVGAPCTATCSEAMTQGGEPCSGPALGVFQALVQCAFNDCLNYCPTFVLDCGSTGLDPFCGSCLKICEAEVANCSAD
jgi:hypothetical protein